MIKYLSNLVNLNNEPKIEIEAKLVRNINDSVSFVNPSNVSRINLNAYKVDINHILFFHIKFSGLTDNDELFNCVLSLLVNCPLANLSLKVYKSNSLTSFPTSASTLYNCIDIANDEVVDQVVVPIANQYGDTGLINEIRLDLHKIISSCSIANPEFIIGLTFDNPSNKKLNILDISEFYEDRKIIQAVAKVNTGINNISSYHQLSLCEYDKGYLDLRLGKLIYLFNTFATVGEKSPFNISIAYNNNKPSSTRLLSSPFSLNFEYNIYQENNLYIIEDFTGNKKSL